MYKGKLLILLGLVFYSLVLSGCTFDSSDDYREITDMGGRTVLIPDKVNSVFSTIASGTIVIYTIDPELLVGVNYDFNEMEKEFILEAYQDLPSYGQGSKINKEAIIAAEPDIIITYGTINDSEISFADNFQEQTNIPVLMVDGALEKAPEAYRFLGKVFDLKDRTELLATYAEGALYFASEINALVTEQISIYYGNGIDSLETVPTNSTHAELFNLVNVKNVAVIGGEIIDRVDVSSEQIIVWNPEVIILNGEPSENESPITAVESFKNNSNYQNVRAVINDKVFAIPKYPYSWFDRPQSVNRLIGIYWLTDIVYPELKDVFVIQEAKEFYKLFYHYELSEENITLLLGNK